MKFLFSFMCTVLTSIRLIALETSFCEPEDLEVVIFPGNSGFSVFHVFLKRDKNNFGYAYVGISTSGKTSKNRWTTRLMIDTNENDGKPLNFMMTIPHRTVKESDKFFLQVDRPLLKAPDKLLPLEVQYRNKGILVFQSHKDADKLLKINMEDNTASLSWIPRKQFEVRWHKDGFDILSGSEKVETWLWETASKVGFRGINGGVTAIYRQNSSFLSLFLSKELFYLK